MSCYIPDSIFCVDNISIKTLKKILNDLDVLFDTNKKSLFSGPPKRGSGGYIGFRRSCLPEGLCKTLPRYEFYLSSQILDYYLFELCKQFSF